MDINCGELARNQRIQINRENLQGTRLVDKIQRLKNINALVPLIGDCQIAVNVSAFCDSLDFLKYLMDTVGLNPSICSEYCLCYQG